MSTDRAQEFLKDLSRLERDLPCSPALLQKISTAVRQDSSSSLEEISALIVKDQALSARVLALANSSFYGLQGRISSVSRAVSVLGLREIRNLLYIILLRHFAARIPSGLIDLADYLEHNFRVGLFVKHLSRKTGIGEYEDLFTAGLLHDIGKLLTALHRPGDWRQILRLHSSSWPFATTEMRYWGVDHGMIGARVLSSWYIPSELTGPIHWHHQIQSAPVYKEQTALLAAADELEHLTRKEGFAPSPGLEDTLSWFEIDLEAICAELQEKFPISQDNPFFSFPDA
ncbi:MAG: HDOD domain-containing protein [Desulfovibrionales bacterium]